MRHPRRRLGGGSPSDSDPGPGTSAAPDSPGPPATPAAPVGTVGLPESRADPRDTTLPSVGTAAAEPSRLLRWRGVGRCWMPAASVLLPSLGEL